MSETDNGQTIKAVASTQVKLCPCDKEEPAIWFRLIQAQFGKSNWQSYFELLWLPMEMQGLKPSILMGILKQHLPKTWHQSRHGSVSLHVLEPTTTFHAGGCSCRNPTRQPWRWLEPWMPCGTLTAAMTSWSQLPRPSAVEAQLLLARRRTTEGWQCCSKRDPSSSSDFFSFQNPGNGMCKFHNFYGNKAHKYIILCSWSENWSAAEPLPVRWQSQHMPLPQLCISRKMQASFFSKTSWLMTGWQVFGWHWSNIEYCSLHIQCWSISLLKGADGQPIPSWGFV